MPLFVRDLRVEEEVGGLCKYPKSSEYICKVRAKVRKSCRTLLLRLFLRFGEFVTVKPSWLSPVQCLQNTFVHFLFLYIYKLSHLPLKHYIQDT
jgi:hypothetical protein